MLLLFRITVVVKVVVVSTPEFGPDGKGGFTFPVMENLIECMQKNSCLSMGFDWAGSTNQYKSDKGIWDELFHKPSGPIQRYRNSAGDEKAAAMDEIHKLVVSSHWFSCYTGQVKGAVRQKVQEGYQVWMVCIDGGEISQVEQMEMPGMADAIKQDAIKLKSENPSITVKVFPTFQEFETEVSKVLPEPAFEISRILAERLDAVDTQDRKRLLEWLGGMNADDRKTGKQGDEGVQS
jgi:hypothetical protein